MSKSNARKIWDGIEDQRLAANMGKTEWKWSYIGVKAALAEKVV